MPATFRPLVRSAALLTVFALLAASPALASPRTLSVPVRAAAAVLPDEYEPDDTNGTARPLPLGGAWSESTRYEMRTLDETGTAGDQDWYKFDVSEFAYESYSYLLEARPIVSQGPDPVIEVFGPGAGFLPTDPSGLESTTDPAALAANDDGAWTEGGAASVSFVPPAPGRYYVRVRSSITSKGASTGSYYLHAKIGQTTRLSGNGITGSAVALSRQRFAKGALAGRAVLLAPADRYIETLSAATLAGALDAPILLTYRSRLSDLARAEIARLRPSEVILLGSSRVFSDAIVGGVRAAAPRARIRRVYGTTPSSAAYAYSRAADASLTAQGSGTAKLAFVVGQGSAVDALIAGPMAAANSAPLLLTHRDIPSGPMLSAFDNARLGITDVVIVGGTNGVSREVESFLRAGFGTDHVKRIGTNDRYRTARTFAGWATRWGAGGSVGTSGTADALSALCYANVGLASGERLGEALSAGAFAGGANAPILLTPSATLSPWVWDIGNKLPAGYSDYRDLSARPILRSYVFGSRSTVSEGVRRTFDTATGPWGP